MVADMIAALAYATVDGSPAFDSVGAVNDVEAFIRVADPIRADEKVVCGIVEGTIEERTGNNGDQQSLCRLPFDIVVRFLQIRRPGDTETVAVARARTLLEAAKSAIMVDPSRDGNANLCQWSGEVINGTTVKGTLKPITGRTKNEAIFTAAFSGACTWVKSY